MIEAYPLAWPPGWPRTDRPTWSRFQVSQNEAQQGLLRELRLLGAKDVIISTNIPLRRDGLPYARRRAPDDQGVAVYFKWEGNDQCMPCDKWRTIAENMQAIRKTIEALRGLERWGAKEMVNAAFRGFKALPESIIMGEHTARAWWEVLEVSQEASLDVIRAAYKAQLHNKHPDKGGSQWEFEELQKAFREATG
jgi:DnaJ-domain-containing protein 1